ncbi:hypothetical protein V8G54_002822 [Vigna mungo]|uniref:Uncharacterized protein n=1 Tax=Vigna mungo TaxID=3915 RepID=A0AAQ3PCU9_VIGMU
MRAANEMNDYEDIIAVLSDDNDNSQQEQARKKSKTSGEEDSLSYLFQLDQPVSLQDILGQDQKTLPSQPHLGGSSSHYLRESTNTRSTIQLNPNLSERINVSVSTGIIVPNPSNNMALLNSIFSSENCSTSTFSFPQNNPKFWPAGTSFGDSIFPKTTGYSFTQFESPNFPVQPYASFGVGNYESQLQSPSLVHPYAAPSVGTGGVAANNLDGNSLTQFQSPRLVHPYAIVIVLVLVLMPIMLMETHSINFNHQASHCILIHQQFSRKHRLENNRAAPSAPSAIGARPQYLTHLLSRQPFLRNFNDFLLAWEAWKKSISPILLTEWPSTMKVAVYVPRKAVINTMRLYGGPIDYILFEVTEFGNLDLYGRLMTEKKYAKIVLPSHTLILFTTETRHCYLGSVFKGDTVIVEHL